MGQQELAWVYGNMTTTTVLPPEEGAEDGELVEGEQGEQQLPEGFGDVPWIMSHVNKAATLVSASVHINAGLGVIRGDCFRQNPPVHLLFFVGLRRVHQLMLNQLKYLWYILQNTPEMYRGASTQWLQESVQVFRADLDTTESIFEGWNPPNDTLLMIEGEDGEEGEGEKEVELYQKYERPGVKNLIELLRAQTFQENMKWDRVLIRKLMRFVFSQNDLVAELGAGTGEISSFLNETGWVQSHAYDYSRDVQLITFNSVRNLAQNVPIPLLGAGDVPYDWVLCLSVQCGEMLAGASNLAALVNKGFVVDTKAFLGEGEDGGSEGNQWEESVVKRLREVGVEVEESPKAREVFAQESGLEQGRYKVLVRATPVL